MLSIVDDDDDDGKIINVNDFLESSVKDGDRKNFSPGANSFFFKVLQKISM